MNKRNFTKLTPINNVNLNVYEDALDFAMHDSDIKNVAMSGSYGSGKSSVLESYKNIHKEINFLHISLAHFGKETTSQWQKKQETQQLEGKILNQLVQQIEKKQIPKSQFGARNKEDNSKSVPDKIALIIFALVTIFAFSFKHVTKILATIDESSIPQIVNYIFTVNGLIASMILGFGSIAYFIIRIVNMQYNGKLFKKFSIKGHEIELFENKEDSYFDKHLDEIVYMLDNSSMNCIVFEDIDRYGNTEVFQQLRDINTLLNYQNGRETNPIKFLYLIKDDTFSSKERTKFFDFIIPIIPVVDSSNSYDKFIELFKDEKSYDQMDKNFLQDISLYVDDMRVLKNVYNEYVIYNAQLSLKEQDCNKLLAIILYKNLFPKDFASLQLNQGYVYSVIVEKKKLYIEEQRQSLSDAIEDMYRKESEEYKAHDENLDDLKQRLSEEEFEQEKIKAEDVLTKTITELHSSIYRLNKDKENLVGVKISRIINEDNAEWFFDTDNQELVGDVLDSYYYDLIKYLIREGMLDETYQDYIAYFYPNSLSRTDKAFIRNVLDDGDSQFNYQLDNVQTVVNRLKLGFFNRRSILNYDLLNYLLNSKEYEQQLIRALSVASKNHQFIMQYMDSQEDISRFVSKMTAYEPSFVKAFIEAEEVHDQYKARYLIQSATYNERVELSFANTANVITDYISEHHEVLYEDVSNINKFIENLKNLDVKFLKINIPRCNKGLLEKVYENNLYAVDRHIISDILRYIYEDVDEDAIVNKNYTSIKSKPEEPLARYIDENINEYLDDLIENSSVEFCDDEADAISLLNNDNVREDLKLEYIERLATSISDINDVNDITLWSCLMDRNVLAYSEDNALSYYVKTEHVIDDTLTSYLNRSTAYAFSYENIDDTFGKGTASKFFWSVIKCNDLIDGTYKDILNSLNRSCPEFNVKNISDQKMNILIKNDIINMQASDLIFIRENYKKHVIPFIKTNIRDYINVVSDETIFDLSEMKNVIQTDINYHHKISLLNLTDEPVSMFSPSFTESVKCYIVKHNFNVDDIEKILIQYNLFSSRLKELINDKLIENIDYIIENAYKVSYVIFDKVCESDDITEKKKKIIFANSVKWFKPEQIEKGVILIGMQELLKVLDGKQPQVEITEENADVLESLKQKAWISSYKPINGKYNIYGKRKYK